MTLKSFIVITPKHSEAVPIGVLKLLVENVSSVNLVHVVESLLKTDGSIDHERLLAKYSHDKNGEEKYIDGEYRFVRNAKQLITLPVL